MYGEITHRRGGAIKAVANKKDDNYGWVEGYLVAWGDEYDTDLQGEHFTPRTNFCLDWFQERPVLYHHGLDGEAGLRKIGTIKTVETDDMGVWVQAQIDLRDRYASAVYDMVKSKEFGWSSGSVDHLVKIANNGEILVWPIIEGSITPTPAQPGKTSVRAFKSFNFGMRDEHIPNTSLGAFKAALSSDTDLDYLRGLEARVDRKRNERVSAKSSFLRSGDMRMSKNRSKRLAKRFANALGVRTTERELEAVASELENDVDDEIAQAAADELENEALLAALEEEMVQEEDAKMARRSIRRRRSGGRRSRRSLRRPSRRRAYRRGYRNVERESTMADDEDVAQMAEEIAAEMEDELTKSMDEIAAEMADDLAAEMEEDMAVEMEEEGTVRRAARNIRRRALRRALRQLDSTSDTGASVTSPSVSAGGTGSGDPAYLGEDAEGNPIPNTKRYRRRGSRRSLRRGRRSYRRGYRNVERESTMADDLEDVRADEEAILAEEVAEKAYRNGFRRGVRRAFRTTDTQEDADVTITEDAGKYEDDVTKRYRRRRRPSRAVRKLRRRRRSIRRARRSGNRDDATMRDDEETKTEEEKLRAFRRGYRAALRKSEHEDSTMTNDPYATNDESSRRNEDAYSMDDDLGTKRYRRRRRGRSRMKSRGYRGRTRNWKRRAVKSSLREAGGQRRFGSRMSVTDVADRNGAYMNAFKSYIHKGLGLMSDTEKYILQGKGKVDWRDAQGSFKSVMNGDGSTSYKAYSAGSDSSAGFAIPPDWVTELNKNVMTQTEMAGECRTRTTTSDVIVQPSIVTTDARRAHAANVSWPGETTSSPSTAHRATEDEYHQVNIPIHLMMISKVLSNNVIEDASFSVEDEITEAFSEAVAKAYDELIWSGDGQGKLQGIVVNDNVVGSESTGMSVVGGYVPTGSTSGLVTADSLKKMMMHLPRNYRQRAKWYMNSNTALQISTLKDANGNYLIDQRDESLQSMAVPDRLFGRPIIFNEWADDSTENAFPIIYADLSKGYVIGKRVEFTIQRFDDSNYAEKNQTLFLGRARLGGQVLQPAAYKVLKIAES